MKLFATIKTFAADESGAATIERVGQTAVVMGLGSAAIAAARTGANSVSIYIQASLSSAEIAELGRLSGKEC